MAKRISLILIFIASILGANEIPIDKVKSRIFKQNIKMNSQVIQLSSSKSSLMARLGGKVIEYHVSEGQNVKRLALIATIESLELTSLISQLEGLKKEQEISKKNYAITQKLYKVGAESLHNLNVQEEEKNRISSQISRLQSKLSLVDRKDKNRYRLYAKTAGRITAILAPLNSVVNANEPLLEISKGSQSFLIKSFIPLKYASQIALGQKGEIRYGGKVYAMEVSQILPYIDAKTQQLTVLSRLDTPVENLFVNTFLESTLFLNQSQSYLSIKKTALSFFKNEWVVFVPSHEDHEEEHHEEEEEAHHEEHEHEEHEEHEEEHHDEHGHDEHAEEMPYAIRVIKILKENDKYVAIEGLEAGEEYVSNKSYYVKSLLLKSSLGGHGH